MFNFTTTTIVNSFVNNVDYKGTLKDGLYIKNVGSFKVDEVIRVDKKDYEAEGFATATLAVPASTTAGDIYRVSIDVELYKSESSLYARPWPTKGKQICFEAVSGTSGLLNTLAENAVKYMNLVYDTDILAVSKSDNNLVITAKEGTQVLKSVILEKWVKDTNAGDTYAGGKWSLEATATTTEGNPGFGTYKHIIHNVILPTYENMKYGNAVANAPKLDGEYTQYIVTKRAERDPYGTGAVGQVLVSETQHVFWVESAAISTFEAAIKEAGDTDKTFDDNDADGDGFGKTILND